jgi:hypothetical protein
MIDFPAAMRLVNVATKKSRPIQRIQLFTKKLWRRVAFKTQGSEANPLPAAKADLGSLFDFQHKKKSSM